MSKLLRTPEERFASLPGFAFAPHYVDVADRDLGPLRMHYVDEGEAVHGTVLMLHGEPSWSYLYRKLIGPVAAAGWRAVAPDHVGFGRPPIAPSSAMTASSAGCGPSSSSAIFGGSCW